MKIINFSIFFLVLTYLYSCSGTFSDKQSKEDHFIDSLVTIMTLEEKIGQMTLFTSNWDVTGSHLRESYIEDIKTGRCGNIFNAITVEYNTKLQKIAVEKTRLGIPMLFGYDVIHGYKTIFPIPLAEACSWDLKLMEKTARYAAMEMAASGLNWTFSPMVDISRDPRWGRVAEGAGEDPYLGSLIAQARVKGFQGNDLKDTLTVAACVKHFAAYGAPQAGRDYHSVDMSERTLFEVYLPPYKAAVDAGVASVMTSFNDLNGIPSTGNKWLLTGILRNQWGFNGVIVTDYTSINELVPHGFARDEKHAAELAVNAGVDMDMQGAVFYNHIKDLMNEGKIKEELINKSVKRILKLKYDLGLFEDPYCYLDETREKRIVLSKEIMAVALESAQKSVVLLKNDLFNGKKILPLAQNTRKIAVIGPLANNKRDMLGTWHASGDTSAVITIVEGLKKHFPLASVFSAKGCATMGNDKSGFSEALAAARKAEVIVLALGENFIQSGEAASRSNIDLPGVQNELAEKIMNMGKPTIALILAGRPLTINKISEEATAILYTWHLGTMGGEAIAKILNGEINPSAKLVTTIPRNVGQVPIFYNTKNTGRPFDPDEKFTSKYLDVPNEPLYPFGYGMSYTSYLYKELSVYPGKIKAGEYANVVVKITNTGNRKGDEIVQLYIKDKVASVVRPVKELKDFRKISLEPGETKTVEFEITPEKLAFYNAEMKRIVEPGEFEIMVGTSSDEYLSSKLVVIE